jgi:1-acyl-sn-glycerol-3-phosphate acyltransferase
MRDAPTPRLRDGLFLLCWSVWTVFWGILGLPMLLRRSWTHAHARRWAQASLFLLKYIASIHSLARGYTNILDEPVIYAAKHQSTWETLMLWVILENPAFVIKRELYWIPIFGWYLWRSGQIAINRRSGKQALANMIAGAEKRLREKRPIVIFPEGTRKQPYEAPRYKQGVAHVSAALALPVVPVALNAGKFWPKQLLAKQSGHAVLSFLPVMPPAGTAIEPWLADLERRIEKETTQLLAQV